MKISILTRYKTAKTFNQLVYCLQKVPLLKSLISESLFKQTTMKTFISWMLLILRIALLVIRKTLYITIVSVMASIFAKSTNIEHFVYSFLAVYIGCTLWGAQLTVVAEDAPVKWECVKTFQMPAKRYALATFHHQAIERIILALLCSFFLFNLKESTLAMILFTFVFTLSFLPIKETMTLLFFNRYKRLPKVAQKYLIPPIAIIAVYFFNTPVIATFFFNPISLLVLNIILTIAGAIAYRSLKLSECYALINNYMMETMAINTNSKTTIQSLTKASLRPDENIKISQSITQETSKYQGYTLLNHKFMTRHQRLWKKPIYKTVTWIVLAIVVIVVFANLTKSALPPEFNRDMQTNYGLIIQISLVILYFANITASLTSAFYLNCDHCILHYAFYRRASTIWKQYLVRLKTLILLNFIPAVVIILGLSVFIQQHLISLTMIKFFSLSLSILAISVIFTTFHLFLYYVLQPYNQNMEIKNPAYSVINLMTYFFLYNVGNYLEVIPYLDGTLILIALLFIVGSTFIVYKVSPTRFRARH